MGIALLLLRLKRRGERLVTIVTPVENGNIGRVTVGNVFFFVCQI